MKIIAPLRRFLRGQPAFTLIEMMVALTVAGALAFGISISIGQLFSVNGSNTARMQAITQVENAVHYINRDAQMAQNVQTQGASGFPLTLSWISWSDNDVNTVTYSLSGTNLVRQFSVNGGQPSSQTVAKYIDTTIANTNCSFDAVNHKLIATFTSSTTYGAKAASETRQIKIIPRAGS
jgi:prepilin-type N-terminal cleavage/methylation domain-containing protein